MPLILVGKRVLFQPLNKLVDCFNFVPLSIILLQRAYVHRFRRKNTYLGSIFWR